MPLEAMVSTVLHSLAEPEEPHGEGSQPKQGWILAHVLALNMWHAISEVAGSSPTPISQLY